MLSNPSFAYNFVTALSDGQPPPKARDPIPFGPIVPYVPPTGPGPFGPGGGGSGGGDDCTTEKMNALAGQIDTACEAARAACEKQYPDGYLFDCGENKVKADCTIEWGVAKCAPTTGKTPPRKTEEPK